MGNGASSYMLDGRLMSGKAPVDGDAMTWNATTGVWEPKQPSTTTVPATTNQDIYIDGVTGIDTNSGLTKAAPLRTILGYFAKYGTGLPIGARRRLHLAGIGGADPWVSPVSMQTYDEDMVTVGTIPSFVGNSLVYRGPQNMVAATPATGPVTAALDNPVASRIINSAGAADAAGLRTEFLFTVAAPGWTANDLGPRGIGAFVRVTRAGAKRYFELPIADNTAASIIVDTVGGIVADLLPTDTVEIVVPGAALRGATSYGGLRFLLIDGVGAEAMSFAPMVASDQGCSFERVMLESPFIRGSFVSLDRCRITELAGVEARVDGSFVAINCAAFGTTISLKDGTTFDPPVLGSRPDAAADPAVTAPIVGLTCAGLSIGGEQGNAGFFVAELPVSAYGNAEDGIAVKGHGTFHQTGSCPYVGGDSNTRAGLSVNAGGKGKVRGVVAAVLRTTITGGGGDLWCEGLVVPYGAGAGGFQEAIGYNGNVHRTTIAAGVPLGQMSLITKY